MFESQLLLRQPDKLVLASVIKEKLDFNSSIQEDGETNYVIDEGMLLQWLPWQAGCSYKQICNMYVEFLKSRYGKVTVVFDGYEDGPTIKDNAHLWRTGGYIGTDVQFTETMILQGKKKSFLANNSNKQQLIFLLSEKLEASGMKTLHAKCDADLLIVKTAVRYASTGTTILVGDDTDLLVLLCKIADMNSNPIYFTPRQKQKAEEATVWNIQDTKSKLGESICNNILFIHAIFGCDSTSRIYGLGKGMALRIFEQSEGFRKSAAVFCQKDATKEDVVDAGEAVLLCLFKGTRGEGLDKL